MKIFSWIIDATFLICAVIFLVLGVVGHSNNTYKTTIMHEYKANWNTGPIIDITSTATNCPINYHEFINSTWPGNKEGCECMHSTNEDFKGKIFATKCDEEKIGEGCDVVVENSPRKLSTWRGKKLCVLRMSTNFWALETDIDKTGCKPGTKKCGILDTGKKNLLCITATDPCPINEVEILPGGEVPIYKTYKKIPLDNGYNLFLTNTQTDRPVVTEFLVSQFGICIDPTEGKLGENQYILNTKKGLERCHTKVNNVLNDVRFKAVDTEKLSTLYKENRVSAVVDFLPSYPKILPTQDHVSLYKINYFGWRKACLKHPGEEETAVVTPQTAIDSNRSIHEGLYIVCILHMIYLIGIFIYKAAIAKFNVGFKILIVIDIISGLFLLIILILSIVVYVNNKANIRPFESFIHNECGDEITTFVFSNAFEGIKHVNGLTIPIFSLVCLEILLLGGFYILMLTSNQKAQNYGSSLKYA